MIYFIPGASNKCKFPDNFGAIVTPSNRDLAVQLKRIQSGWRWICDNGAFTGQFNADKFYRFLEKMKPYQTQCQFVIVPDVVGDARATLERFEEHAARIRELDYRVAFAAQDGQEFLEFPHEFDTLFIGGSTDWKLSEKATICIKRAQTLGKWVHIGRVNTRKRIQHFALLRIDSVDGTAIALAPNKNTKEIIRWMAESQNPLFYL